ncbi:hypothetical protein GGS26DRAFT_314997 [Hypomontagnella submonticulosa]|nr:hypothetical protein GGS26DRAFT_314997 [Hypomontagnella submonticulosa]
MDPVSPDNLAYRGSALDAFDELAGSQTSLGLFHAAHSMWCADSCSRDLTCPFLHYCRPGSGPPTVADRTRAPRPRYNKHTANLFTLMGGDGYQTGISQKHQANFWPLCEDALRKVDQARKCGSLLFCDYSDWTKKRDPCAQVTVQNACRDTVQWFATWLGTKFNATPLGSRIIAFTTMPDDLCIPPLDLVHQRFRMYGLSFRDLVGQMVAEGWGRDAMRILLCTIRQYFFQYIEKVDFEDTVNGNGGVHALISRTSEVWDSIVYRTHTANAQASSIVVGRATASTLSEDWLLCSNINNCISMDLAKSALHVYEQDNHMPTASFGPQRTQQGMQGQRRLGYHSIYLDLLDDLVDTGCPEPLVNFASSGFLFVQINHRYLERSLGHRIPIHNSMADVLGSIFGDKPTDARLDGLFHLRWLVSNHGAEGKSGSKSALCPDLLAACLKRQEQRKSVWNSEYIDSTIGFKPLTRDKDIDSQCAIDWITGVHMLSRQVSSPDELQKLLTSVITQDSPRLSIEQLDAAGSRDGLWALCVACQVDCSDDCEWLAFAKYTWGKISSASHVAQSCQDGSVLEPKRKPG